MMMVYVFGDDTKVQARADVQEPRIAEGVGVGPHADDGLEVAVDVLLAEAEGVLLGVEVSGAAVDVVDDDVALLEGVHGDELVGDGGVLLLGLCEGQDA